MTIDSWVEVVAIVVAAMVTFGSAVVAMKSATKASNAEAESARLRQHGEAESARLRQLEERVAQKKFDLYQPILKAMGDMLTPGRSEAGVRQMEKVLPDFMTFVAIWGSDEAVHAFSKFRAGGNPPAAITMRLISDFLLAARKDLSGPDTSITGLEAMGMRINDLYDNPDHVAAFTLPFDELAMRHDWTPPWEAREANHST